MGNTQNTEEEYLSDDEKFWVLTNELQSLSSKYHSSIPFLKKPIPFHQIKSGFNNILTKRAVNQETLESFYSFLQKNFGNQVAESIVLNIGPIEKKGTGITGFLNSLLPFADQSMAGWAWLTFGTRQRPHQMPLLRIPYSMADFRFGEQDGVYFLQLNKAKMISRFDVDDHGSYFSGYSRVYVSLLFLPSSSSAASTTSTTSSSASLIEERVTAEQCQVVAERLSFSYNTLSCSETSKHYKPYHNHFTLKWKCAVDFAKQVDDIANKNYYSLESLQQFLQNHILNLPTVTAEQKNQIKTTVLKTTPYPEIRPNGDNTPSMICRALMLNIEAPNDDTMFHMQVHPFANVSLQLYSIRLMCGETFELGLNGMHPQHPFHILYESYDHKANGKLLNPLTVAEYRAFCKTTLMERSTAIPKYLDNANLSDVRFTFRQFDITRQSNLSLMPPYSMEMVIQLKDHPFLKFHTTYISCQDWKWGTGGSSTDFHIKLGALQLNVYGHFVLSRSNVSRIHNSSSQKVPLDGIIPISKKSGDIGLVIPPIERRKLSEQLTKLICAHTTVSLEAELRLYDGIVVIQAQVCKSDQLPVESQSPRAPVTIHITMDMTSLEVQVHFSITQEEGYYGLTGTHSFSMFSKSVKSSTSLFYWSEMPTSLFDMVVKTL